MTSDGFQGDVYESSTSITSPSDELCSLIDEGYWHENDLILAAELGKALLDRNRKLEIALEKSKELEQKKQAEIEFLSKEIAHIRELSQEKMAFVDEADRYTQELDQNNQKLLKERAEDKRKIRRLLNTISILEEQVSDLSEQLSRRNLYKESVQASNRQYRNPTNKEPGQTENFDVANIRISPVNGFLHISHRPKPVRDHFIDDDFQDQPELGAHLTHKFALTEKTEANNMTRQISTNPNYWNSYVQHDSYRYRMGLSRSFSWPKLGVPVPINLALELETSDQLTKAGKQVDGKSDLTSIDKKDFNNFSDPDACDSGQLSKTEGNCAGAENGVYPTLDSVAESSRSNTTTCPEDQSNKDSGIQSSSETAQASNLNPSISGKSNHGRLADEIEDLLDDVSFLNCLDRIYNPHIRSQYKDLIKEDYKPHYKQLFHEAFQLLNHMRNTKFVQVSPSQSKSDSQTETL